MVKQSDMLPGQIWVSGNPGSKDRTVVAVSAGIISFVKAGQKPATPASQNTVAVFRSWIHRNGAFLPHSKEANPAGAPNPVMTLAQRIQLLRKAAGLTQEQLAERLGISRSAIAALETGRTAWSLKKHLSRLAVALGVDELALLTGEVEEHIPDMLTLDERDLLALYRGLDTKDKLAAQCWIEMRIHRNAAG